MKPIYHIYMKARCILLILFTVSTGALAQEKLSIEAGANYSSMDGADNSVGYFGGVRLSDKLTDRVSIAGTVFYSSEIVKVEDVNIKLNSAMVMFYFKLYPVKDKLSVLAGGMMQYAFSVKVDGEDTGKPERGRIAFVTGLGYDINDKFDIAIRYLPYIGNTKTFNNTMQLGVGYKL